MKVKVWVALLAEYGCCESFPMIPTMIDPAKLTALTALRGAGLSPDQIRKQLRISRRTWFRWNAEIRRVKSMAEAMSRAS